MFIYGSDIIVSILWVYQHFTYKSHNTYHSIKPIITYVPHFNI